MLQLGVEGLGLLLAREVAVGAAPVREAVDDAVDELLDGALADGGAVAGGGGGLFGQGAAEVLGGDDVGGVLRPVGGELDVLLLEYGCAVGACDDRGADLPPHLIVGVDIRAGKVAPDEGGRVCLGVGCGSGLGCHWLASVDVSCVAC